VRSYPTFYIGECLKRCTGFASPPIFVPGPHWVDFLLQTSWLGPLLENSWILLYELLHCKILGTPTSEIEHLFISFDIRTTASTPVACSCGLHRLHLQEQNITSSSYSLLYSTWTGSRNRSIRI